MLCPHLTVAANLFLGDENVRFGLLQHGAMVREGQKLLDDLGFDLPAGAPLSSLTIGQQQLVATARAERRGAKFLIFDEPTAYLTRQEAAALFPADPPPQGARRHHRLYQPSAGGSVRTRRSRLGPARRRAGRDQARLRKPTKPI